MSLQPDAGLQVSALGQRRQALAFTDHVHEAAEQIVAVPPKLSVINLHYLFDVEELSFKQMCEFYSNKFENGDFSVTCVSFF